ncbi:MAG TPA: folylpolyglutamate synthase/dihydrofolate synthase family protein [Gemmatimonadaceae bacterium]|nr:folylpolyglutamate synthase/dihydrofolate synthase family protein [Gemmatimonadaceae bacterium]
MGRVLTTAPTPVSLPARDAEDARYAQALEYLFARTTGPFKFGLERTVALLATLGDPHRSFPSIHIAGTNGKGSSVATADALLRAKGLRVGAYTSPHLVDFRERIVVDGACISADEVTEFVERWTPLIESIGATFFEATTALAFAHFARAKVDVAVIETGLGGRLDSTNVIDPIVAGVTTIDYDHTEYLGNTLEQIAAEKAGIYKRGRPAVVGEGDRSLREVLARDARKAGASTVRIVAEECSISNVEIGPQGTTFDFAAFDTRASLTTPLAGKHQAENVAFALVLLDAAGAPYATTLREATRSLAHVRVAGRFERQGRYIFDVAHNPEGSLVLAETLASVRPDEPVVALFSVLADKDWRAMLLNLAPRVSHFVFTLAPTAPPNRLWDLEAVQRFAVEQSVSSEVIVDFAAALARASAIGETTLVTGSFHTVGDAMARLQQSPESR